MSVPINLCMVKLRFRRLRAAGIDRSNGISTEIAEIIAAACAFRGHNCGRGVVKRSMCTMEIVVVAEIRQFLFQIAVIPEEHLIKQFSTDGTDRPFDKRV